ncbi:MAG TPA: CmcI family methyltransferase [Pseudonocardiaceae bacterium]|nr:CmcI family methyltransferase [Pseudonocardiaceae bacterium]
MQRRALLARRRRPAGRYVDIRDRAWATDLGVSQQLKAAIQESKHNLRDNEIPPIHWKGVLHMKDPFSLACYPLVIQEVRPRTIIEIGSYHGGSALWLADILGIFGLEDTHVHSFDVDLGQIAVEDPRITFHQADSNHVEEYAAELLLSLHHPWLLIEDAHVNLYELLTYFDRFLKYEDFIIIEDTLWPEKYPDLKRFLLDHNGQYLVDTTYTDLFGYNVTWHLNGYIRKMRD